MPAAQVVDIGLTLLDALRVAHNAGVLHRDVKPANVLMTESGNVVLTVRVRAARDLDPHASVVGEVAELTLDHLAKFERGPARRGDTELAGVGAGARRDVDQPFGPGLGAILAHEDRVDFGQRPEWHPSQNQVFFNRMRPGHSLFGKRNAPLL